MLFADDDVYGYLKNISGVLKALLLKKSVGFITLQSIVVNFLVQFGGNPYKENSQYSAEDRLQRYNCKRSTTTTAIYYID